MWVCSSSEVWARHKHSCSLSYICFHIIIISTMLLLSQEFELRIMILTTKCMPLTILLLIQVAPEWYNEVCNITTDSEVSIGIANNRFGIPAVKTGDCIDVNLIDVSITFLIISTLMIVFFQCCYPCYLMKPGHAPIEIFHLISISSDRFKLPWILLWWLIKCIYQPAICTRLLESSVVTLLTSHGQAGPPLLGLKVVLTFDTIFCCQLCLSEISNGNLFFRPNS